MRRNQVEEHSQPQDRFRAESEERGTDQNQNQDAHQQHASEAD